MAFSSLETLGSVQRSSWGASIDMSPEDGGEPHGQQCNVTYRKPGQDLPGSNPVVSHFFTLIIVYREA